MQWLQNNCSQISVRINSTGGNVLDGYSIVSAILSSKVPVNTYIDGLAASIAGVIAVAGKKCYMMDYGTLMVHNPNGGEDKELLNLVKNTLVTILSNRTSKSAEEMSAMMDKETWITAKEALSQGLVDEVVSSGKKIKLKKTDSLSNMAIIYNKLINKPNMEKINAVLKLKNEATEENVVSAIEALNTENEGLKTELETLKNKLTEIENAEKAKIEAEKTALKNEVEAFADKLVADKKIKEEEKAEVITNASVSRASFGFVKNIYDKITTDKPAAKIFDLKNVVTPKGGEDRSTWTIRDWETKDSKGLGELKNSNPDAYETMYNAFYKK